MKDVIIESTDVTEEIDNYINKMKTMSDGQIDKHKYYWYSWSLRDAFKTGMLYQKGSSGDM